MRVVLAIVCLLAGASAQADVGIGVSATSNDATIYVPVTASNFMFEPYVRYSDHEVQFNSPPGTTGPLEQTYESSDLGVGIFRLLQPKERITFYYGGRVAYVQQRQESIFADYVSGVGNPDYSIQRTDLEGYSIVPSLGLTYSVIERLWIGAEVGWVHSELDGEDFFDSATGPTIDLDQEVTDDGTRAAFIVRFFF